MPIRILETENNRRGDLFEKLMVDLFVALGYERPRMNVAKTGREIDLVADHRLENRRAIAECKATSSPVGGNSLNKFAGVIDAERETDAPLTGFFISLAGFTESAIEQESRRRNKIVMLGGDDIIDELIDGRIVVGRERATEVAGRLSARSTDLVLDPDIELLAHQRGWLWAVHYMTGRARTHVALIHADGTPLLKSLADEVVAADRACGGALHEVTCLNPAPLPPKDNLPAALAAYRLYVRNECGYIHLDGLPADSDVGSRRLMLENIFVPLHCDLAVSGHRFERQPVGRALSSDPRLAVLAPPGGGKSTLIKRLAMAYSDPEHHGQIDDEMPPRPWLPLFFRCRELRDLARGSFADLLDALSMREPVRQYGAAFRNHVDAELLAGRILLLVDGLDEISDPGDRAAFVGMLRTALQAYPETALVVTSREAGFRHVATHVSSICTHITISAFDDSDIRRLSIAWHVQIIGDTEKVRSDANDLASTIVGNDRIKRLAVNPLLLTTLLLVKRWIGSLPTRRAALYGKAVELLLMTWNTEAHAPISQEEALPQLCYVAVAMMLTGIQKISRTRLAELIRNARTALPTELGFVNESVDRFIQRIEDRSSLLMRSGLDLEDGRLVEFFEFRHLTFQEYLAARAIVEGWNPHRSDSDTLVTLLEPHFADAQWREVIPLAAVMGSKATEGLIQRLNAIVEHLDPRHPAYVAAAQLLVSCIADEAPASPATIRAAVRDVTMFTVESSTAVQILRGKYGSLYREELANVLLRSPRFSAVDASLVSIAVWIQTVEPHGLSLIDACQTFAQMLQSSHSLIRCEGALGIRRATTIRQAEVESDAVTLVLNRAVPLLALMLESDNTAEIGAACLALSTAASRTLALDSDTLLRLIELWLIHRDKGINDVARRTLVVQRLGSRAILKGQGRHFVALLRQFKDGDYYDRAAALVAAWYLDSMPRGEIAERASDLLLEGAEPTIEELVAAASAKRRRKRIS